MHRSTGFEANAGPPPPLNNASFLPEALLPEGTTAVLPSVDNSTSTNSTKYGEETIVERDMLDLNRC